MAQSTTTASPSVKKYVDYANQQVDEQAILDKYNAATLAQFNVQREQNRQNENAFYNQMYNTQKTAMDTIRQSNAAAVSSGASRGVQAANELSAILGLQSESVAQATELAQANRQTAQEETAAVLENVLNAYQQAAQERSQLVSQGIESASVDAQEAANEIAAAEAQTNRIQVEQDQRDAIQSAAKEGTAALFIELANQGYDYASQYSTQGEQALIAALNAYNREHTNASKKQKDTIATTFFAGLENAFGISQDEVIQVAVDNAVNQLKKFNKEFGFNASIDRDSITRRLKYNLFDSDNRAMLSNAIQQLYRAKQA